MRLAITSGIIACLAACTTRPAPGPPVGASNRHADSLRAALDAAASGWLQRYKVPSLAVAYISDDRIAWTRVQGLQSDGIAATESTLYNVASLTKPVFAETMLRLVATRRMSLDESIAPTWVDPDVADDPRHRLLTPRIVLSNRTGFPNWRTDRQGSLRFEFDPGTRYQYSGEGFEYLRRFVERKEGAPIEAIARERLFGPFGMRSTSFVEQGWFAGRVAYPADGDGKWGTPRFAPSGNAADRVYATVGDYATFVIHAMRHDGLSESLARQRDSIQGVDSSEVVKCRAKGGTRCPTREGYTLGWSRLDFPDGPMFWHTGSDDGEKALVVYFPRRREGAVMFMNGENGFPVAIEAGLVLFPGTAFAEFLELSRR